MAVDSELNIIHAYRIEDAVAVPGAPTTGGPTHAHVHVQKLAPEGGPIWTYPLGQDWLQSVFGVAAGPDGSAWVAHDEYTGAGGVLVITGLAP